MTLTSQKCKGRLAVVWAAGYFDEFGNACIRYFRNAGWIADHTRSMEETADADVVIILGINFYPLIPFQSRTFLVGFHTEQLPLPGDTDRSLHRNLKRLKAMHGYFDLLVEWSPANYRFYQSTTPAMLLPHGSGPLIEPPADHLFQYDLLFLGNPHGSEGRRQNMLSLLKANFNVCPIHYAWGTEKLALIRQSRLCLNLHQFHSRSFESPRIFELLSAGACVISEEIEDSFPFVAGKDYASFHDDETMLAGITALLADSQARHEMAVRGQLTASRFPFEQQFGLLKLEIERRMQNPLPRRTRVLRWGNARLASLCIATVDRCVKLRRKVKAMVAK